MHPDGTCPVCGAERRTARLPEPFSSHAEPSADGPMRLARLLNGTPWRDEWRSEPSSGDLEIDLSWLKW